MFLHVDMDAFFASIEEIANPKLCGLPVIVGGLGARGVVSTANYVARRYGVHSAMPIMQAHRLCPYGIYLPVNMALYRKYSLAVREIILQNTPFMEQASIDEFYLQYAPRFSSRSVLELGWNLKHQIKKDLGLSSTIGIAPSRTLAKMVSNEIKPAGVRLLTADQVQSFLESKQLSEIPGVGQKTFANFLRYGIRTVADFWATPPDISLGILGKARFEDLAEKLSGGGLQEINKSPENVSYSSETTFARDLHAVHDKAELGEIFTRLSQQVAADLQRKGYVARTFGIKLRYTDFRIATRDQTVDHYTADAAEIRRHAGQCLKRVDLTRHFRLLGVRASNLLPLAEWEADPTTGLPQDDGMTLSLF